MSSKFFVRSIRDGKEKSAEFSKGVLINEFEMKNCDLPNGTEVHFTPDDSIFINYNFLIEHINALLWNYAYLNAGLKINFNGKQILSKNGLLDLKDVDLYGKLSLLNPLTLKQVVYLLLQQTPLVID